MSRAMATPAPSSVTTAEASAFGARSVPSIANASTGLAVVPGHDDADGERGNGSSRRGADPPRRP